MSQPIPGGPPPLVPPPPPDYNIEKKKKSSNTGCCIGSALLLVAAVVIGYVVVGALVDGVSLGSPGGTAGLIKVEGPIMDSEDTLDAINAFEKSDMEYLLLRIDTPGGSVGASEEIYRAIEDLRSNERIVVVSLGNTAASGGYYIAAGADYIFANEGTLTGSIGVIAPGLNLKELADKMGLESANIKSGEHKDTGSMLEDMAPQDRALLQNVVYDLYRQFLRVILQNRAAQLEAAQATPDFAAVLDTSHTKVLAEALEWQAFTTGTLAAQVGCTTASETALRHLADGRIFTGYQAVKVGLVDEIGSQKDARDFIADMMEVEREDLKLRNFTKDSSFGAWLSGQASIFSAHWNASDPQIQAR